ncbi:hypothetical protein EVG20_g2511 [Dentipellis fragilis]|uniref:Uncharacterized protein n=1 Tax=Dentipellis fragilis TaxID=205917 RepID=A0A4Y9Z9J7_9AGAM|nr:hypothetical protein EVG20_g2511 [Dentipellis fragilis]
MATISDATHLADPAKVYAEYQFGSDRVFQQGLSSILSSGTLNREEGESEEDVLRRAKLFYFKRITGYDVSEMDAKSAEQSLHPPQPEAAQVVTEEEPQHLTFSQLKELIEQGKTDEIPNNKKIPDALNVGPLLHFATSSELNIFLAGGSSFGGEGAAEEETLGNSITS